MNEEEIVKLYLNRDEQAIAESEKKYHHYLHCIAYGILRCYEDSEEAVNDTYVGAWNSIPPHMPECLSGFLGKITRRVAIKMWEKKNTQKRGGDTVSISIEELSECIPHRQTTEHEYEKRELVGHINHFLKQLPKEEMQMFVCRYFYFDSIKDIASRYDCKESKVKMKLKRTREKLQVYLSKEGYGYESE